LGRDLAVDVVVRHLVGDLVDAVPEGAERVDLCARRWPATVRAFARYLADARPRSVLSALPHTNVLAVAGATLARYRGRLLVAEHNQIAPGGTPTRSERVLLGAMRLTYPRAHRVIAVSHGVKDSLTTTAHIDPHHIDVIYNPVITPQLHQATKQTPDHPWFAGPDPIILGIGRLTRQKNFPNLLHAFAQLHTQRPAKLIILGEGEDREALTHLVHQLHLTDHVDLPGFAPNPYAYLAHAHLFALSSDWEGLPTVLIEALAANTPVVSTDCPSGPREILDHGRHGELVPMNDPTALAQAIHRTLDKPRTPTDPTWLDQFTLHTATTHYAPALGLAEG
jgi:glycosyltransferase involved in cell wall biosynthesis